MCQSDRQQNRTIRVPHLAIQAPPNNHSFIQPTSSHSERPSPTARNPPTPPARREGPKSPGSRRNALGEASLLGPGRLSISGLKGIEVSKKVTSPKGAELTRGERDGGVGGGGGGLTHHQCHKGYRWGWQGRFPWDASNCLRSAWARDW